MFESWRYKKEQDRTTLKRLFDTASEVSLGRDAVSFIENNGIKVNYARRGLIKRERASALYNKFRKSIFLYNDNKGDVPQDQDLPDLACSLVHEARHAWQDKKGLIKLPMRVDLLVTEKLLIEADAYSYDAVYTEQRKNRDLEENVIVALRYGFFLHFAEQIISNPENYIGPANKLTPAFAVIAKVIFAGQKMRGYQPQDFSLLGQTGFHDPASRYFPETFNSMTLDIEQDFKESLELMIEKRACDPSFLDRKNSQIKIELKSAALTAAPA